MDSFPESGQQFAVQACMRQSRAAAVDTWDGRRQLLRTCPRSGRRRRTAARTAAGPGLGRVWPGSSRSALSLALSPGARAGRCGAVRRPPPSAGERRPPPSTCHGAGARPLALPAGAIKAEQRPRGAGRRQVMAGSVIFMGPVWCGRLPRQPEAPCGPATRAAGDVQPS